MASYSFKDVVATITGAGGSFNLGDGSAAAEEGITISRTDDVNTMMVGADGKVMHSLHAGKPGQVTVRLLKTSPVNEQLSQMYALQTASSALHGNNIITLRNTATGDVVTCQQCAFKRFPDLSYAKDGGMNEWVWDAGIVDSLLGS
jgi:hypothetical protein